MAIREQIFGKGYNYQVFTDEFYLTEQEEYEMDLVVDAIFEEIFSGEISEETIEFLTEAGLISIVKSWFTGNKQPTNEELLKARRLAKKELAKLRAEQKAYEDLPWYKKLFKKRPGTEAGLKYGWSGKREKFLEKKFRQAEEASKHAYDQFAEEQKAKSKQKIFEKGLREGEARVNLQNKYGREAEYWINQAIRGPSTQIVKDAVGAGIATNVAKKQLTNNQPSWVKDMQSAIESLKSFSGKKKQPEVPSTTPTTPPVKDKKQMSMKEIMFTSRPGLKPIQKRV